MKRIRNAFLLAIWLCILIFVADQIAQGQERSNTFYAREFQSAGNTVGARVAAAQNSCNANTVIPCYIVIDADMAAMTTGSMPAKCSQCYWLDYRTGNSAVSSFSATGVFDQTGMHEYVQSSLNSCDPSTEYFAAEGNFATDALSGCVNSPPTATAQANGVAGYATGGPVSIVGGRFQGRCTANGCNGWGVNAVVQDVAGLSNISLAGVDVNVNLKNPPSTYPVSAGGVNVALNAPNAGVYGAGYICQKFGANPGTWQQCYISADKATDQAFIVGAHTGANPQGSQNIYFNNYDAGGVGHISSLNTDSAGNFVFTPFGGAFKIVGALTVNGSVTPDGTGLKHKRVAGCATAASAGAVCTNIVGWTSGFADANYTVTCSGDVVTSGVPADGGVSAKAAGSVTFRTVAVTAVAAQYTTIDCQAMHD